MSHRTFYYTLAQKTRKFMIWIVDWICFVQKWSKSYEQQFHSTYEAQAMRANIENWATNARKRMNEKKNCVIIFIWLWVKWESRPLTYDGYDVMSNTLKHTHTLKFIHLYESRMNKLDVRLPFSWKQKCT